MQQAPLRYFTHGTTLAYRTYGHGPVQVLAFHGFGRTGADFQVLEGSLGAHCTIHAFDLHFHGASPGYPHRADQPFTPQELAQFMAAFLDHHGLERATLLGYSLGGRMVLNLLEQLPQRVERAFLVAPDGLKTRPWYRGMAASRVGRWAYKRFVEHPGRVHAMIDLLRATRLMNERMHRFLKGQTDSRAKRQLVHDVWLSYRAIEPDLAEVAARVRAQAIPVHLVFGRYDRVIPARLGDGLASLAPEHIERHELPFGHVLIGPELGRLMAGMLGVG
ncbi:MAG: alpha/beta fold hydrolase [Flavobacteriales bacterium]